MQRLASCLLFAAALLPAEGFAAGPSLPDGWRLPVEAEFPEGCAATDSRTTAVVADFNGDHLTEGAYLAVRKDGSAFGLLAFVYKASETEKWFVLDTQEMGTSIYMCLSLLPPGTHEVLGAEGYDEPKSKLTIEHPGIYYYRPESAESFFSWQAAGNFKRFWLSD